MRLVLGIIGFASIVGQVVLVRELVAIFDGNELAIGLVLACGFYGERSVPGNWRALRRGGVGSFADARRSPPHFSASAAGYDVLVLPFTFSASAPVPDFVFPMLALLAGSMAGACFPPAVAWTDGGMGRAVDLIHGEDLVGGCLEAILVAGLFIPVLGIPQTCYGAALLTLAGFILPI